MADEKQYTHFIAVDFGTAGCGIAVKIADEKISREIHVFQQWLPRKNSIKCPTIILLNKTLDCIAFGVQARKNYKKLMKNPNESGIHYLFEYFKMSLYKNRDDKSHKLMVKAVDGRELPAVTVFSKALQYIKEITLKYLNEQVPHPSRSILWILTVPAIWSPAAKQVMRTAAENADFCTENNYVKLALEPEVASLYCIKQMEKSLTKETSGQHLVVDCGGGTVDIAVHKWVRVSPDTALEVDEIHKIHGGPCGSFAVNAEFEQLLLDILSTGTDITLSDIKKQCGAQWNELLYEDFEKSKCSFSKEEISIAITKPIRTYVREKYDKTISELIENYKKKWGTTCDTALPEKVCNYIKRSGKNISEIAEFYKEIKWDDEDEAIVIPAGVMTILFSPVIDQIIQIIEDVLNTDAGKLIKNIFMVGGFSNNDLLFNKVKEYFSSKVTVGSITSPDLAVLYGSIEFAKNHGVIRSRIMHITLGIETWDDFKIDRHDERKKYIDSNGKSYCKHVFTKFVEVGQSMSTKKSNSTEQVFIPIPNKDNTCCINIYGSYEKDPLYINDDCSFLMGEIKIDDVPSASSGVLCEVTVHMDVRGTEIVVTAINNATKKELPLKLDWMKEF